MVLKKLLMTSTVDLDVMPLLPMPIPFSFVSHKYSLPGVINAAIIVPTIKFQVSKMYDCTTSIPILIDKSGKKESLSVQEIS